MRFLTPTDNKRLNELIGFLCITIAVLMALALIAYSTPRRGVQRQRPAVGRPARAQLDRPGGRLRSRSPLPGVRLRGVSASCGDRSSGLAMAPQPRIDSQVGDAGGLRAAAAVAALAAVVMALPGVRGTCLLVACWARDFHRIANRVQSVGRESGRLRPV